MESNIFQKKTLKKYPAFPCLPQICFLTILRYSIDLSQISPTARQGYKNLFLVMVLQLEIKT